MIISNPQWLDGKKHLIWFLLLIISFLATINNQNINGIIAIILPAFGVYYMMVLSNEKKENLLTFLLTSYALVIAISVAAWIPHLFGIDLPYRMDAIGEDSAGGDLYYFENHYLYLINTTRVLDLFIPRFSSVFLEPGYLGCLCSVCLFLGGFNMRKWQNCIFLISIILTLSLAAWIIVILSYFLFRTINTKNAVTLIVEILILVAFYIFFINFKDGDNIINNAIIERVQFNSSTGQINGYNRSSSETDSWFWNSYIHSDQVLFGVNNPDQILSIYDIDWKSYTIRYGLFGLFSLIIFLSYPITKYKGRQMIYIYCLIFILIFVQTSLSINWLIYTSLYILGVNRILREDSKLLKLH